MKNQLSIVQSFWMYLTSVFAVTMHMIYYSSVTHGAWAGLPACIACVLILVFALSVIVKKNEDFSSAVCSIIGKTAGKAVLLVYCVWLLFSDSLFLRFFSDSLVCTVLPGFDVNMIIAVMAGVCAFALKDGLTPFARMNGIILPIVFAVMFLVLILMLPEQQARDLLPVSTLDGRAMLDAGVGLMGGLSLLTLVSIFGKGLEHKERFKKSAFITVIIGAVIAVGIFIVILGSLGSNVVKKLQYPFYDGVKEISVGVVTEVLEAFAVTMWISADFILIGWLGYAALELMKNVFDIKNTSAFVPIVFLIAVLGARIVGKDSIQIQNMIRYVLFPGNCIMMLGIPIVIGGIQAVK